MYKNILFKLMVAVAFVSLLVSCDIFEGPNFSRVPSISFSRIDDTYRGIRTAGALADSIIIIIKFRDGDGDLGITSEMRNNDPRFMEKNPDGTTNRYFNNYFVTVLRKTNGVFQELDLGLFNYSGAFIPLRDIDGKPGPIEGDLEYGVAPFFHSFTPPNDTLKFRIQITDRAKNESNIIETDEVVLNIR